MTDATRDNSTREILQRDRVLGKRVRNISTRIEEELYWQAIEAARSDGRTLASWLRMAMLDRLTARQQQPPHIYGCNDGDGGVR